MHMPTYILFPGYQGLELDDVPGEAAEDTRKRHVRMVHGLVSEGGASH